VHPQFLGKKGRRETLLAPSEPETSAEGGKGGIPSKKEGGNQTTALTRKKKMAREKRGRKRPSL